MNNSHQLRRGLWTAGALIGAALLLKWMSSHGVINGAASQRLIQVAIGVVVILSGNVIPKQLPRLSADGCPPAREQSRRRLAGWAFVLAGIAYSVVWLVAPIDAAPVIGMCVLGTTVLLVLLPCLWLYLRRSQVARPGNQ